MHPPVCGYIHEYTERTTEVAEVSVKHSYMESFSRHSLTMESQIEKVEQVQAKDRFFPSSNSRCFRLFFRVRHCVTQCHDYFYRCRIEHHVISSVLQVV
jgi:hypothetical protein